MVLSGVASRVGFCADAWFTGPLRSILAYGVFLSGEAVDDTLPIIIGFAAAFCWEAI